MKKRDKRLDVDEEASEETWQIVKESVRQMKHDNKRNNILKAIRTSKATITGTSPGRTVRSVYGRLRLLSEYFPGESLP